MSTPLLPADALLQECLDDLDEVFLALARFPPNVVAMTLRLHMEALLLLMIRHRICTRQEVRRFIAEMEHQVLPDFDACGGASSSPNEI